MDNTPQVPLGLSEFQLRQYDWLKKEIEGDVQEMRALERHAVIGLAQFGLGFLPIRPPLRWLGGFPSRWRA
jgi:hypothetical protein